MKCYYPIDSAGNRIGFKTPEACVYDASGTSLTTKLAQINSNLRNKQDTITDLDTIRAGAKNGTELFNSTKYSAVKSMTFGIDTDTGANNTFISFLRSDGWVLRVYFDERGVHYGAQNPNTKAWTTLFDK